MGAYVDGVLVPPADAGSLDGIPADLQPAGAGQNGYVVTFVNANGDLELKPASGGGMTNPMKSVGDLIVGGAVVGGIATPEPLTIGSAGYILRVVNGSPTWRELFVPGTSRPPAASTREGQWYWSTNAAAGLELAVCTHQGSGVYAWVTMPYNVTATGVALMQAADAAAARAAINAAGSGTLAARPAAPAAGDTYLCTDYDMLLTCAVAGTWRVVGADVMNVTIGPFSGASTQTSLLSATGTGNGPTGGPGYTYATCVYLTSPATTQQIIAGYINLYGSAGWALKIGDTSGKFGIYQTGMNSGAVADLGPVVGTGAHSIAVACAANGLSLRYSVDGGTVGTVAITGTYAPPDIYAAVGVGNTFIESQPFIAGGISWVGVWSSVLSDADLQAVSAQYATGLPGAASTTPAWAWLCAKYPDGLVRHTPVGSAAKPLAITDTTRLLARTAR